MAIPSSNNSRLFYRCAIERYEDAQILLKNERTTGVIYLAGYGIECILKALIFSVVRPDQSSSVLGSFRGQRGHSYDSLKELYQKNGGPHFPPEVKQQFTLAAQSWSPDYRYKPGSTRLGDAEDFMAAVAAIIEWAKGRL